MFSRRNLTEHVSSGIALCNTRNCPASSRFQRERDRERERPRSREPRDGYNTYYSDSPAHDYQFRDRERDLPPRERPLPRYPIRNQSQHNIPPLMPHLVTGGHPPPPLMSLGPPPTDRKDYYDSYNRYFRINSIFIHVHVKQTVYRNNIYLPPPSPCTKLRKCGGWITQKRHKIRKPNCLCCVY